MLVLSCYLVGCEVLVSNDFTSRENKVYIKVSYSDGVEESCKPKTRSAK